MLRHKRLEDSSVGVDGDEKLLGPEARLQDGDREDRRRAVKVGLDVTQVKAESNIKISFSLILSPTQQKNETWIWIKLEKINLFVKVAHQQYHQ